MRCAMLAIVLAGCFSLPSDDGTGFLCQIEPVCGDGFTCLNERCVAAPRSFLFLEFPDQEPPDEPLDNFPLLVRLDGEKARRALMRDDASDLRFTALDGTVLAHELDTVTDTEVTAWVRVPQIAGRDTILRVEYGQAEPAPALAPEMVWSDDYAAVFHFTGDSVRDSTAHHRDGTAAGLTMPATALIGGGREFMSPGFMEIAAFDLGSFTISGWIYEKRAEGFSTLAARQQTNDKENDFWIGNDHGMYAAYPAGVNAIQGSASKLAQYVRLAVTVGSTGAKLYVNGDAPAVTNVGTFNPTNQNPIFLGADRDTAQAAPDVSFLDGVLDEVRIETVERTRVWIHADYLSQSGGLIRYGEILRPD